MTLAVIFDSIGFGEWFVLLAVVLIVVGPKRLPSAARTVGQYYSKFRRAAENFITVGTAEPMQSAAPGDETPAPSAQNPGMPPSVEGS